MVLPVLNASARSRHLMLAGRWAVITAAVAMVTVGWKGSK